MLSDNCTTINGFFQFVMHRVRTEDQRNAFGQRLLADERESASCTTIAGRIMSRESKVIAWLRQEVLYSLQYLIFVIVSKSIFLST
jgi:hypothetical protein